MKVDDPILQHMLDMADARWHFQVKTLRVYIRCTASGRSELAGQIMVKYPKHFADATFLIWIVAVNQALQKYPKFQEKMKNRYDNLKYVGLRLNYPIFYQPR